MHIRLDDLRSPQVVSFLQAHLQDMRAVSPPESKHALDVEALQQPDVQFWTLWMGEDLLGCAALKRLSALDAELKSMRTKAHARKQGIGTLMLNHVLEQARLQGYRRISLETGSMPFFAPARRLYQRFGFVPCPPFASYRPDPNSVFMTLLLLDAGA
ncbi:GNAT family N-acetyltransferase [Balneatrix alpica]|uniref:GNAT family N-acetyltransferase n=1 Tax=Balneatrix alpica TaxID=75684 RepID=A0ABV5Z9X8_9GAMM|nr:GNAT family N-acetyltransferase [Balneatrix alpica]